MTLPSLYYPLPSNSYIIHFLIHLPICCYSVVQGVLMSSLAYSLNLPIISVLLVLYSTNPFTIVLPGGLFKVISLPNSHCKDYIQRKIPSSFISGHLAVCSNFMFTLFLYFSHFHHPLQKALLAAYMDFSNTYLFDLFSDSLAFCL